MAERPPPTATFRFYGDLCDLPAVDHPTLTARLSRGATVKDAVEARGVPHVEVGLVLVAGEPVGLDHHLAGGERVAVYPRPSDPAWRPDGAVGPAGPAPARFALDGHLGTLARRLRLLGLDTWYRHDVDDAELAGVAAAEDRVVLTRDVGLLKRSVLCWGAWVRSTDPEDQTAEVVGRFDLGGRLAPYTRCPRCNGHLRPATEDEAAAAPAGTRRPGQGFEACEDCGHLYWQGSHTRDLDRLVARARGTAD
jgi:uncharacterized protein with PIN domain